MPKSNFSKRHAAISILIGIPLLISLSIIIKMDMKTVNLTYVGAVKIYPDLDELMGTDSGFWKKCKGGKLKEWLESGIRSRSGKKYSIEWNDGIVVQPDKIYNIGVGYEINEITYWHHSKYFTGSDNPNLYILHSISLKQTDDRSLISIYMVDVNLMTTAEPSLLL